MNRAVLLIAAILILPLSASCDSVQFFRVVTAQTSSIVHIDHAGFIGWSNAAPGEIAQIQRATTLTREGNWQDFVRVQDTGGVMFAKVIDPTPPFKMAYVPAGLFLMGNDTNVFPGDAQYDFDTNEVPQHSVYVSSFFMDRYEVTKASWDTVRAWAVSNGYSFDSTRVEGQGQGQAEDHPVHSVTWYNALKWCNARSELEGRIPAYYTSTNRAESSIFRTGEVWMTQGNVDWTSGYRLPTEAEWEKAARGGATGSRFPWTDFTNRISHMKANYAACTACEDFDLSNGFHPAYTNKGMPYTSPAGSFAPNGYGLYDMSGNVAEWCWDGFDSTYYAISPTANPRGPDMGNRVRRGGHWLYRSTAARVAWRQATYGESGNWGTGFRCVLPDTE